MEYKQFKIKIIPSGREFMWEVYRLDGSLLEESGEEFGTKELATDDAKEYIDQWYIDEKD